MFGMMNRMMRSAVIGELDEELDSRVDLATLKGEPLRPLIH